jgi:hypothetical protein
MTFPPLCCGFFNVAMRTRFVVAGLSQIEPVATIRQHSVVESGGLPDCRRVIEPLESLLPEEILDQMK